MTHLAPLPLDRAVGAPLRERAVPGPAGRSSPTGPEAPWLRAAGLAGAAAALLALVAVVSWPLHWTALLRAGGSRNPMTVNAAIALTLAGLATLVASRAPARTAVVRGLAATSIADGALVAIEYATGWSLGLDTLFGHPYLTAADVPAGRPALSTAICLLAVGVGLIAWTPAMAVRRAATTCAGAVVSASITLVTLVGYLAGAPQDIALGSTSMALPTALVLSVLSTGVLSLGVAGMYARRGRVGPWLSVMAAAAAMIIAGLVWQAFVRSDGATVSTASASRAALAVAVVAGLLIGGSVRLAQRVHERHQEINALAAELEREIKYRSAVEREANDKERVLFQILDLLPVGVFITKPDLSTYFVNRVAKDLLPPQWRERPDTENYAAQHAEFLAGTDEHYPDDRSPLQRAARGESSHVDDIEIRTDERSVFLEAWGMPVTDDAGGVTLAMDVIVDIGDRRIVDRELAEQAALLDLSRDAIMVTDMDRTIRYWSLGAQNLYGYTREEALGRKTTELINTESARARDEIDAQLRSVGCWVGEVASSTKDGTRVDGLLQSVARFDEQDEITSLLVIITDIGSLKAAHRELEQRAHELERVNRELQRSNDDLLQFAYAASHDLAEPLRAISGPVSLLGRRYRDELGPEADELIDFAVDGCARMQTLIDDLLAFSRVGRLNSGRAPVDLAELMRVVRLDLGPVIAERGAKIIEATELPVVWGTASELRQLLQNLVANALKFAGPDRPPVVTIAAEAAGSSWRFSVTDNGIGIPARHRERVFGMFKRLHARDEYPGTGIGLALVKKIVERHGGEVGVEDAPDGPGCRFWFVLPAGERAPR